MQNAPHPFRGVYEVEPEEYETFSSWIDEDKPEGDPSSTPDFTVPPLPGLTGDIDHLNFAGMHSIQSAGGGYDSFRCFAMQFEDGSVALDSDIWLDGFEFTPGNAAVAHHMSLFSVPNLAGHIEAGLVETESTKSWDCRGIRCSEPGRRTV